MNLLKKNPIFLYQLVFALITVCLSMILIFYFLATDKDLRTFIPMSGEKTPPVKESYKIDFKTFGVVYVELDSPSYAQSNFDINPDGVIRVYFNESMDPVSLEENMIVKNRSTGEEVEFSLELSDRTDDFDGDYLWRWQREWVQVASLTFSESLEPGTPYDLIIKAGVKSESERIATNHDFAYYFITVDEPGILNTNASLVGEYPVVGILRVNFRSPVELADLEEMIELDPAVEELGLEMNDKAMTIVRGLESGVAYTLTIPADLEDIYARFLGQESVLTFTAE